MLISSDSPLRRPPSNLNRTQAQFLDGLRISAEMVDMAYQGLVQQLRTFAAQPVANAGVGMPFAAPAFLYAWSVIDSAHRLKGLVDNFPGFEKKRRVPEVRSFLKEAESVENLRHAVQHMEGSIRQSATPGHAVWGSLSWLVRGDEETVFTCLLTVGALMPGAAFQPINPAGITLKEEIDSVRLTLGETAVHLSELLEVISKVVGFIEAGLRKEFEGFPARAGSDYFIALRVKRNPDGSVTLLAAGDPPKA